MDINLVLFKANGQRKDIPVTGPVTVIGRGEDCQVQVPIGSVSRRHCQLTVQDDKLTVKDLGSANGTYVDNQRVEEAELSAGSRLVIGPVVFTVQIDGLPAEIQQVKTRGQKMAEGGSGESDEVLELAADEIASAAVANDEQPIDLEAPGAPVQQEAGNVLESMPLADEEDGEIDPISALEALASENEDQDDKS